MHNRSECIANPLGVFVFVLFVFVFFFVVFFFWGGLLVFWVGFLVVIAFLWVFLWVQIK